MDFLTSACKAKLFMTEEYGKEKSAGRLEEKEWRGEQNTQSQTSLETAKEQHSKSVR